MNHTFVIGIAGGTASGKSTFTETLEKRLASFSVRTLHMDAYFKEPENRPYSKSPVSGKYYIDDNHPLTMDLPRLSKDMKDIRIDGTADVLIVEGLLTLWDESIEQQLDLRLFVECRQDERIVRRIRRNSQWGLSFEEITDVYLDLVRFRHDEYVEPSKWKADLILNGTKPSPLALDAIEALVHQHISMKEAEA